MPKLFSYVVEHDRGHAPNPYSGLCTLCRCKYKKCPGKPANIVEQAEKGDWIVGTGGANRKRSAGHGKLVYAMRVSEKLTRGEYYRDSRFRKKKPVKNGSYLEGMGDNKRPRGSFEREQQFVLVSRHFYYFGRNAISFPKKRFPDLEKRGPGFRKDFDEEFVARFVNWLHSETRGKIGDPCMKDVEDSPKRTRSKICKPSC